MSNARLIPNAIIWQEVLEMIYKINVDMIAMLKNSKFIPSTTKDLEHLINLSKYENGIHTYFKMYKKWYREVYPDYDSEGINALYSLCLKAHNYYCCLAKYSKATQSFTDTLNKLNEISEISNPKSLNPMYLFDLLKEVFYFKEATTLAKNTPLAKEFTQDEITEIYKSYIELFYNFFDTIHDLESKIVEKNKYSWVDKVFDQTALAKLLDDSDLAQFFPDDNHTSNTDHTLEHIHIQGPKLLLISFCSNTNKMLFSSQKMISAMLISSDSRQSFGNRAFGFMYGAKFEDIVAMSFSDVYSSTEKLVTVNDLHNAILRGLPLVSLEYVLKTIPTDLLPIDNLNKLLNKTIKHNEILLTPDSEPYGIFVYKEQLDKCFSQVCSLCTVMQLPLFISKQDGSMLILPWQNVFEDVQSLLI